MGYMMVLASSDENWAKPIIFGVVFVFIFCILIPMLCLKLTKPRTVKERLKMKKKCTVKTQARVIDMYGTMPAEFHENSEDWSGGNRTIASYEYFVNGVSYTGSDEIFSSFGGVGKIIDVLYDPNDPSSNCTPWGRRADSGTNFIKPMLIVFGVLFGVILLFLLAVK